MKLLIKQSKGNFDEHFLVLNEIGEIRYRVIGEQNKGTWILHIETVEGTRLLTIRRRDWMIVSGYALSQSGVTCATLIQNMCNQHTLLRVQGARWRFRGDLTARCFDVLDEGGRVMMIHCKRWGVWGDGYELNVAAGKYELVCLGIAVCIDQWIQSGGETVVAINS